MKRFQVLTASVLLTGCSLATADNASDDAQQAIAQGDFRLYRIPVRGMVVPGVDIPLRAEAVERCGIRILTGVGDTVSSEAELAERKQRTEYAKRYNQLVYQACIKR